MRKQKFLIPAFVLLITTITSAQNSPLQTFSLKDGTSIKGYLKEVLAGDYVITTQSMGEIKVSPANITNISTENTTPAPAAKPAFVPTGMPASIPPAASAQITTLLSDPQVMGIMQELMADPSVSQIMNDPALMQAALTMDPQTINANPKVQQLMKHPKMQELLNLVGQKMGASTPPPISY